MPKTTRQLASEVTALAFDGKFADAKAAIWAADHLPDPFKNALYGAVKTHEDEVGAARLKFIAECGDIPNG